MAVQKNDDCILKIEALSAEGSGIARQDGLAVFVGGAMPGDTVRAHIIKVKKNYAIGKLTAVLEPSANRVAADCPLFPRCGGCVYRSMSYSAELAEKKRRVEDAFLHLAHCKIACETILSDAPDRYRNKAQYPVVRENGRVQIGFYASRSHRVIPCTDCRLQPEEFGTIVSVFRDWLTEFDISCYDAETHTGLVRHLYLRKGFSSGEILVCVVQNGDRLPHAAVLYDRLREAVPAVVGLVCNRNTEKTNVILGKTCKTLFGKGEIEDTLCGVPVRLSPLSFYQVNHTMAKKLYQKAAEFADLQGGETVLDLYCGAGTIGLSMAKRIRQLYGAEIIPEAVENAKENARRCGAENAAFFCGDAADAAARFRALGVAPDVVLLDPPRKGCADAVLQTVASMEPKKIVYISCDPATLARDSERLFAYGYAPARLAAADLFPRTSHIESVCLFLPDEAIGA